MGCDDFLTSADPLDRLDYTMNWGKLFPADDSLSTSSWSVTPAGPTLSSSTYSGLLATIWITGGTVGKGYKVTNHVLSAAGREGDYSFRLVITDN